jgi:hypothetical protein
MREQLADSRDSVMTIYAADGTTRSKLTMTGPRTAS